MTRVFGIFVDQSTKTPLRLKVGEDYQGLETAVGARPRGHAGKDQQAVVMALPQPDGTQPAEARVLPVSAVRERQGSPLDLKPALMTSSARD